MRIGIVLAMAVVACQPMYGAKPQKLKDPPVVQRDEPKDKDQKPVRQHVDKCDSNFHLPVPAKGAPRDPGSAATQMRAGNDVQARADKAPAVDEKRQLILAAIDHYHRALARDPYDAEVTLRLALIYYRTLRKGCALAMLRRLETLANHQSFEKLANSMKRQVHDNTSWFADYRSEALRQIP